jgi:hypothetical protein
VSALPAFFAGDVPGGVMVIAGVGIALTVAATALVLVPSRELAGAR